MKHRMIIFSILCAIISMQCAEEGGTLRRLSVERLWGILDGDKVLAVIPDAALIRSSIPLVLRPVIQPKIVEHPWIGSTPIGNKTENIDQNLSIKSHHNSKGYVKKEFSIEQYSGETSSSDEQNIESTIFRKQNSDKRKGKGTKKPKKKPTKKPPKKKPTKKPPKKKPTKKPPKKPTKKPTMKPTEEPKQEGFEVPFPEVYDYKTVPNFLSDVINWAKKQQQNSKDQKMFDYIEKFTAFVERLKTTIDKDLLLGAYAKDFKYLISALNSQIDKIQSLLGEVNNKVHTFSKSKQARREFYKRVENMTEELKKNSTNQNVYTQIVNLINDGNGIINNLFKDYLTYDEKQKEVFKTNVDEADAEKGSAENGTPVSDERRFRNAYSNPALRLFEKSDNPVTRYFRQASKIRACAISPPSEQKCSNLPSQIKKNAKWTG